MTYLLHSVFIANLLKRFETADSILHGDSQSSRHGRAALDLPPSPSSYGRCVKDILYYFGKIRQWG